MTFAWLAACSTDPEPEDPGPAHETDGCLVLPQAPESTRQIRLLSIPSTLSEHVLHARDSQASEYGYGAGGVVADINQDGYPDVLLASEQIGPGPPNHAPRLYVSDVADGVHSFREVDIEGDGLVAYGGRVTGPGPELMMYGASTIQVSTGWDDGMNWTTLLDTDIDPELDGQQIFSVLPNQDNTLLHVFFGMPSSEHWPLGERPRTLSLDRLAPRELAILDEALNPLVLATARADFDGDGTLDTAVLADTFSRPGVRNVHRHPGGYLRGATPLQTPDTQVHPWSDDESAWGSHMGIALPNIGGRPHAMITEWGPPLVIGSDGVHRAPPAVVDDLDRIDHPFSWSPIVVDLNGDQRDDVLLTRGSTDPRYFGITPHDREGPKSEADVLLVQSADGELVDRTDTVTLRAHPPAYPDEHELDHLHSSRAGVATDFDRDGRVDILIVPFEGRPLHYEASEATHCLVRAVPEYSPTADTLFGWSWLDHELGEHPLHVDGAMLLGEPEYHLVPAMLGVLRAPSGARIPYDCAPGDLIDVAEPAWATVDGSVATLDLCSAGLRPDTVQSRDERGSLRELATDEDGRVTVEIGAGPVDILLDERYSVTCSANQGCTR